MIRLCPIGQNEEIFPDVIKVSKSINFELVKREITLGGPDLIRQSLKRRVSCVVCVEVRNKKQQQMLSCWP